MSQSHFKFSIGLEWELACQWYGTYTREQFIALSGDEQARIVALFRTSKYMQAVVDKEQADEIRRANG